MVLTEDIQRWLNWADQFVAANTANRDRIIFPTTGNSRSEALRLVEQAASRADQSGRVIISVAMALLMKEAVTPGSIWFRVVPSVRSKP